MRPSCGTVPGECLGNGGWLRIAREGQRSARVTRNLRAKRDRKRDALARHNGSGQR